uniref:Uncharacterized protein n=1 Tax=viral metagenome TaxID=1070528 RepID=A0A6C0LYX0_9ZZZZ
MVIVSVWLSSHITSIDRLRGLCVVIDSICYQTRKPDCCYVSFSYDRVRIDPDVVRKSFHTIADSYHVPIVIHEVCVQSQRFEHLNILSHMDTTSDWIVLCGDNDTLHKNRIEIQLSIATIGRTDAISCKQIYTHDARNVDFSVSTVHTEEYGCLFVRRLLLEHFFGVDYPRLLSQHGSDLHIFCSYYLTHVFLKNRYVLPDVLNATRSA